MSDTKLLNVPSSEVTFQPGRQPIPSEYFVAVDNVTIGGCGIGEDPLFVIGGGSGGVVHTDATLTGDGSAGSPLGTVADKTAVATDGTLTGDGTTGSPLHVVSSGAALPVSEWFGTGKDGAQTFDGVATVLGIAPITRDGVPKTYLLTRDIYLADGSSVSAAASIDCNNFRLFCNGKLTRDDQEGARLTLKRGSAYETLGISPDGYVVGIAMSQYSGPDAKILSTFYKRIVPKAKKL